MTNRLNFRKSALLTLAGLAVLGLVWFLLRNESPNAIRVQEYEEMAAVRDIESDESGEQDLVENRAANSAFSLSDLQIAASARNVPIVFWGKVVDDADVSLEGATVEASVSHWFVGPTGVDAKRKRIVVSSDSDGRFMISG